MKLKRIEHSPLPKLHPIQSTRLVLSKSELETLKKAAAILRQAESMIEHYLKKAEGHPSNFGLSDIDFDLASLVYPYQIEEFLENYQPGAGLRI